jgi:hypothetical protein
VGIKATVLGLCEALTAVWSTPCSRPCRGPPGSPQSNQSPTEFFRGERSPEAPQGRHQSTEQVRAPPVAEEPAATLAHLCLSAPAPWPHLLPVAVVSCLCPACPLLKPSLPLAPLPTPRCMGRRAAQREASMRCTLLSIPTFGLCPFTAALQSHPRVNFCPLPSEQCYQAPGGPEDRGPTWVGSHGTPQRLQVRTGVEGLWGKGTPRLEGEQDPGLERRHCDLCSPCFGSNPGTPPRQGGPAPRKSGC